jgi:hypothetical protein
MIACGGVEGEEAIESTDSAFSCTGCTATVYYGTDTVGDTCGAAAQMTGGDSDEINTDGDSDAYWFQSDSAYHNYKASFDGVYGAAAIGCSVSYKNSYGTWTGIATGGPSATADCTVSWTSSTIKTYCVKVWGLNGYANQQQISFNTCGYESCTTTYTRTTR